MEDHKTGTLEGWFRRLSTGRGWLASFLGSDHG
jgi:hypothetical protein